MKKPLTRRAVTKILLAAPAALAAGPLACQSASGSAPRRLSPGEEQHREELARSQARLKKSVERLRQMEIALGSEPAIHFTPVLSRK